MLDIIQIPSEIFFLIHRNLKTYYESRKNSMVSFNCYTSCSFQLVLFYSLQNFEVYQVPSTNVSEVRFLLYTRENPTDYELLDFTAESITDSHFNPLRNTKILVHGYTDNGQVTWIRQVRDAYFSVGNKLDYF